MSSPAPSARGRPVLTRKSTSHSPVRKGHGLGYEYCIESSFFVRYGGILESTVLLSNLATLSLTPHPSPPITSPTLPRFSQLTSSSSRYTPTPLSPFASQRPELDDPEDEDGLLASVAYIETLITELVETQQIPVERVVIGGFSQGCAVTLLAGLVGEKFAGRVAGVVGLSGYLPLGAGRIGELIEERGMEGEGRRGTREANEGTRRVPVFYMRGNRDTLVPKRYFRMCLEGLMDLGVYEEQLTAKEYEGLGHTVNGEVLRDVCTWLESILPP